MALWDEAAGGWDKWRDLLQRQYGAATERLLDMASVKAGSRVLDVAAGPGYQTVQIAARVGADGYVLASDISPEMVRVAERNVREAEFENAAFKVMDATSLDTNGEKFDAVICRQGVMTFPAPQSALRAMHSALGPAGKIGLSVFASSDRNPYLSLPASIIVRHLGLPPETPETLDVFQFGEEDALAELLRGAGFVAVEIRRCRTPMVLDTVDQYIAHLKESSRVLLELMEAADDDTRESIWAETARSATRFVTGKGFEGPGEILLAAAERA